ncbi:MAG: SUMF1/EgtB/PvdO family nonheme iron enzyme [Caldilineae bacterium]|nr:SUMF1/EgtB/PvdO family nonheme iron enzyme [Caldilineae bacterium]
MPPLPSGTVTFLFTDIEGSTERWDRFPDAMRAALERHDALLRAAVEAHGGQVFKTVGDAFCAAFATAGGGLAAAIEAQRAVTAEDWARFGEGFPPIRVRMGLHTGEATERGGDYFGQPVNRVARIEAAGHGGQVLVSAPTYHIVREHLPDGIVLHDWGEHRLKDLRHTEHIFQLRGPGLPQVDAPPATAEALHPRDRVRVAETLPTGSTAAAPNREADGVRASLEAALRSDAGEAIILTPAEAQALARHKAADWREWRLGRVAEWSQPRYRLDGRFVGLTLLIDQGEEAVQGRWQASAERYDDLGDLLAATPDPAIVVLGPPGGGKSTLLRRLELDLAIAGLRDEGDAVERVTCFLTLNAYKAERPGDPLPEPGEWLAGQWQARNPALPPLSALLAQGRVTLLLDALNEIPAAGEKAFREQVQLWKAWLQQLALTSPGNRVVFSCRSLDYSQSLSTPDLRVPQVRIEPLTDDQVRDFLTVYSPGRWREIWRALDGSPQLEVLRSPYFLALLVEQVQATGEMPAGRSALFTGFVRQALRREVERGSPLFEPGVLLESRDLRRIVHWQWKGPYDLPERGLLLPKLAALAHAMQVARADGERSQVRIDLDEALDLLDCEVDEAILAAGAALAVLDEDQAAEELMYVHQLVQEYFAARVLARDPDPELVRVEWRAAKIRPTVDEVIDSLDPADSLPPRAGTGWEETTILAATMTEDPPSFLRGVMETNLALAGRAAAQPDLLPLLPPDLLDDLRWGLVPRSRDPEADLRDRIACCYAVGDLGDPRFERRAGPHGGYLVPPLVEIPGGTYPIGDDEPITTPDGAATTHMPRHEVEVARFAIGQFPVTNAEWRCFLEAGGYEDERWWDTDSARAWRRGENTAAGIHAGVREIVARCRKRPEIMDEYLAAGSWDEEIYERGQKRLAMSAEELDAHLIELYPGGRHIEPAFWRDARFNHPSQPVVGIGWYEARAYLSWLSAQSGMVFRLPTEVEWEVAARGVAGRRYAYGDAFDRLRGNTAETRIRQTTPVGVFPGGDTPEGLCDLIGNLFEWTSSAFGRGTDEPEYGYPYVAADGREASETAVELIRVVRGGSWYMGRSNARAAYRDFDRPDGRDYGLGLRVVGWPGRT